MKVTVNKETEEVHVTITEVELHQFLFFIRPINMTRYSRANALKQKLCEALYKF